MKLFTRWSRLLTTAMMIVGGIMVLGTAVAGDFHRLVGTINNGGGTNCTWTTPKNTSTAMEMAVFEFQTPAADNYRCYITSNGTGQDLTVRLIGLTGGPLATVVTPVNGVGATAYTSLGAGYLFQCTVASGAGSSVNGGNYQICAQRQ